MAITPIDEETNTAVSSGVFTSHQALRDAPLGQAAAKLRSNHGSDEAGAPFSGAQFMAVRPGAMQLSALMKVTVALSLGALAWGVVIAIGYWLF